MQFIKITQDTTLADLAAIVGDANVDEVLSANGLTRERNIGKQFYLNCGCAMLLVTEVDANTKTKILNTMTGSAEIFEEAALLSEDGWKVLASMGTLPGYLRIPDTMKLPSSADILGDDSGINSDAYTSVMNNIKAGRDVDETVFNTYRNTTFVTTISPTSANAGGVFDGFQLPWGKVTLWSGILQQAIDFPCYPIDPSENRSAIYNEMPEMLYQYEPWWLYQRTGPRSPSYQFIMHRDMFTGDHRDGRLNALIRFCEASLFAKYNGSAVTTDTVTLYIAGQPLITGKLSSVDKQWSGPLLQDDWYAVCTLTLQINEVSDTPLNFDTVRQKGLIG